MAWTPDTKYGSGKTSNNVSNPPMDMEGIFRKFIFGLICYIYLGCIGTQEDILFWIPAYLHQDLIFGSKSAIPTYTVCLFNNDRRSLIVYEKVPHQKSLIKHGLA